MSIEQIETLVRERRIKKARNAIQLYLKRNPTGTRNILQACDWYRRLGLYRDGFLLLAPVLEKPGALTAKSSLGQKALWAARLLNLQGASSYALQVVENLELTTSESCRIAGNIYLTNYQYVKALHCFERMRNLGGLDKSYQGRFAKLGLSDALAGCGDLKAAIQVAKEIISESKEPLLQGISQQACGEYLARQRKFKEARKWLDQAFLSFPKNDETPDFAILLKWSAYVDGYLGKQLSSKKQFESSLALLKRPHMRAEAWLDVHRLQLELGHLEMEDVCRLIYYPGIPENFKKMIPYAANVCFGANSDLHIGLLNDEFRIGDTFYLGLPHELKLLGFLKTAEGWGLGMERAKSLLWPNEAHSYTQLEARLYKLISRIRTVYKVPVSMHEGVMDLTASTSQRISVEVGDEQTRPSFFEFGVKDKVFLGSELSSYYELSRTQRAVYLKQWMDKGWINRHGRMPRVQYSITKP